jgi:hypothetical protein
MNLEALNCLEDYAVLLQAVGRSDGAARLQAATTSIRTALALPRSPRDEPKRQENIDAARAVLGEAAFSAAWSEGEKWAFDDAIEYILESMAASAVTPATAVTA